jgi:ABC-2 type transport system ATP-binding protein
MKQKLALARALIHSPEILYLDEPTSGLDPKSSKDIRDLMEVLTENANQTILLCTHRLEEAERLCDRVMVINKGAPVTVATPRELSRRFSFGHEVQVGVKKIDEDLPTMLREIPSVIDLSTNLSDNRFSAILRSEEDTPVLVRALIEYGADVVYVKPVERSLEDAYLKLVENQI